MLSKSETLRLRNKHIGTACQLYFREDPLKIVRGRDVYLYDENGEEYLDCINNVCHVGHCHPHVVKATTSQAETLNTNSRFLHDGLVTYAERLCSLLPDPLSVVFMTNSGSEATDLALRLARDYTGRKHILTLDRAYHGHVTSALHVSPYKFVDGKPYEDSHVHVVPTPDTYRGVHTDMDMSHSALVDLYIEDLQRILCTMRQNTQLPAAFIAESMQSCGGQIMFPAGYLERAVRLVRDEGALYIADEVQVGFGRVGTHWWAFQTEGVVPDIVTLGKPMGNGHPVSAVVTTAEIAQSLCRGGITHFNTFSGNPVSCAAAHAVLDVIVDQKLMRNAVDVGAYLNESLLKMKSIYKCIGDVRVRGMFAGIDIVTDQLSRQAHPQLAARILEALRARRVLMSLDGPYENVLKFKPPMTFTVEHVDRLLTALSQVLADLSEGTLAQ